MRLCRGSNTLSRLITLGSALNRRFAASLGMGMRSPEISQNNRSDGGAGCCPTRNNPDAFRGLLSEGIQELGVTEVEEMLLVWLYSFLTAEEQNRLLGWHPGVVFR